MQTPSLSAPDRPAMAPNLPRNTCAGAILASVERLGWVPYYVRDAFSWLPHPLGNWRKGCSTIVAQKPFTVVQARLPSLCHDIWVGQGGAPLHIVPGPFDPLRKPWVRMV